jgi:hypothetical protein
MKEATRQGGKTGILGRLSYSNVMVTLLAIWVIGGSSAYAAISLSKNSVGPRQLKAEAVTTGKIATNAVNGTKVANKSLTGADINVAQLGTVPAAASAAKASDSNTVGGHAATCPKGTTLIGGLCFDSASNPPVNAVKDAALACAQKEGFLPTPMELYSVKSILNLGTGVGSDHQFTDAYYANTSGVNYSTVTIDGTGQIKEQAAEGVPSRYICAYPLLR